MSFLGSAKKNAPCVIFIDEIDTIGGRRQNTYNRGHMTLNELLTQLDGFNQDTGIMVVAATNLPQVLDKALTRTGRFDRRVEVIIPDKKARRDMLSHYLQGRAAKDVNIDLLAESTTGFTGSDIFNLVNYGAIEATKRNLSKITMEILENSKEAVVMGPERKSLFMSEWLKRQTAYHESGHALVALHTPHAEEIVKATMVPRGPALGYVSFARGEELLLTKAQMLSRMDTSFGGRIAEEIIFGDGQVTGGAGSDLETATRIATEMVTRCGMSEKVGFLSVPPDEIKNLSPEVQSLIENEVRDLLQKSYERAKEVLTTNKDQLHSLSFALLKYETLSKSEIELVCNGVDIEQLKKQQKEETEELRRKEEEYKVPPSHPVPQSLPVPQRPLIPAKEE